MKQIKIDLTAFLNFGGLLDKFPLKFARTTYDDCNQTKEIDRIEPVNDLFRVFFKDGENDVCAGRWIAAFVNVELILDQKDL